MNNKKRVSRTLKQQDVIKRFKQIHGNKYDYSLFIYENIITKSIIKCNTCGFVFKQRPHSHLAGNGCPNCAKLYIADLRRIPQDELIKRFIEVHGNKFDYSKTITNGVNNKTCIICREHGEFYQTPSNHLKGHGCTKCQRVNHANFLLLDQKTVINRFINLHGNRFGYDNFIYKGHHIKGEITCKDHGAFWQTPTNHLKGQGCPKCNYSKGEAALENIFIKNNIKYEAQFKLPYYNYEYDFHLPDYGVLIEFHGKQHYEPVMEFGGVERFRQQIENDKIKRSLAREYRTLLIEVHYKYLDHKNIEKFEQFFLKKLERKLKSSNWMTS